jgi:hypothetical protein
MSDVLPPPARTLSFGLQVISLAAAVVVPNWQPAEALTRVHLLHSGSERNLRVVEYQGHLNTHSLTSSRG